jgi:GMP synthase-like glutamine amidotransferase
MHRDDVAAVPEGATLLGYSAVCPVQAFYRPGRYMAVQCHPETTPEIMEESLLARREMGTFTADACAEALQRARLPDDGVIIGKVFLEFMLEASCG